MITKAIIEEVISNYQVKVRIPIFDSSLNFKQATDNSSLSDAISNIILGCLFKESGNASNLNLDVECLTANSTVKLSKDTTIGDITYKDLKELIELKVNFQSIIDTLR